MWILKQRLNFLEYNSCYLTCCSCIGWGEKGDENFWIILSNFIGHKVPIWPNLTRRTSAKTNDLIRLIIMIYLRFYWGRPPPWRSEVGREGPASLSSRGRRCWARSSSFWKCRECCWKRSCLRRQRCHPRGRRFSGWRRGWLACWQPMCCRQTPGTRSSKQRLICYPWYHCETCRWPPSSGPCVTLVPCRVLQYLPSWEDWILAS